MRRRTFLQGLGAVPLSAQGSGRRPNFVFILTDDQRWDAMSLAGHPFVRTPHMDRIGREGALFRNAFVTTPLCSPSRASFLTGRYVRAHGVKDNTTANNGRSHELVTYPRLLRESGYETAYVGKWHMGNDDSPRPGFDRWVSFKGQGRYDDPELNVDGQSQTVKGYITDVLTDHAVEFIKARHAKPFSLCVGHKAVHGPFTPAERHKGLFADAAIRRSPNAQDTLEGKPMLQRQVGTLQKIGPGTGPNDELIRNQLRCLTSVDEGVGRILSALEETGQLDDTVVVFTSDNGYLWGEHGLGDKRAAYEESIRIPMVVRYPKLIRAGSRVDGMALNVDVAPTLLDLAGVPVPAGVQGRSLVPLLRGKTANWRRSMLAEYYHEPQYPRIPTWHAVRTERWKFVRYPDLEGADELYDLREDAYEMRNLAGHSRARKALEEMRAELGRLERAVG